MIMQQQSVVAFIIVYALLCGITLGQVNIPCGPCSWEQGVVLINSTLMLSSECVALGGDCCTWNTAAWCDGLGGHQNPAEMEDANGIMCRGCYSGWNQTQQ